MYRTFIRIDPNRAVETEPETSGLRESDHIISYHGISY